MKIPKPGLLDGLTSIDDLLRKLNEVIIQSNLIQSEIYDIEIIPISYNYPSDGTYLTITEGITTFDFETGTVKLATGVVLKMSHSLQSDHKKFLRSVSVLANKEVIVQLDTQDMFILPAALTLEQNHQEFKTVRIKATRNTEVVIFASTSNYSIIRYIEYPSMAPTPAAWDISRSVWNQLFSVYSEESDPGGLFFRADGLKLYVIGGSGDVNEYDLSVAWDISTASAARLFDVSGQEATPWGLFFRADGQKMYITGLSGLEVNEYDLGTPWKVDTAVWLQLFDVSGEEIQPTGVFFRADGAKMYISGMTGTDINEYDLSTPWNISTAVWLQNFLVAGEDIAPDGVFFRADGLKMYVAGADGADINEYDLSVAWDISTALWLQTFSIAAQEANLSGLFFKPDGLKMYIIGYDGMEVNEYDLV